MTQILNNALKIKGVVGRMAHAKSSDHTTSQKNMKRAPKGIFPAMAKITRILAANIQCRQFFFVINTIPRALAAWLKFSTNLLFTASNTGKNPLAKLA